MAQCGPIFGQRAAKRLTCTCIDPKRQIQFLAAFNHTKPSYKQDDIVFRVYVLRHILNGLIATGCVQSKLTESLETFSFGLIYFILIFIFLKMILCEIKGHCHDTRTIRQIAVYDMAIDLLFVSWFTPKSRTSLKQEVVSC